MGHCERRRRTPQAFAFTRLFLRRLFPQDRPTANQEARIASGDATGTDSRRTGTGVIDAVW
jgi:hypothetical protein